MMVVIGVICVGTAQSPARLTGPVKQQEPGRARCHLLLRQQPMQPGNDSLLIASGTGG
jgi:hypothetical protein